MRLRLCVCSLVCAIKIPMMTLMTMMTVTVFYSVGVLYLRSYINE